MKIVYKESFVIRLENQLKYISIDNPTAAKKFKKDLITKIKAIPRNPKSNRRSIYFDDENIRDLIFKGYTIVYRITKQQIEIFGFVKYQIKPTD
ncbi:type II toxin-antitoxin system RelE/ParE family toxin [Maribellus mangrovi]|uniref:type II toxin-antitoxin system RelE/ParE family toxin n=1 Tax=Maribellus mangrovi TaxID=3133146 RepID=UPI003460941F